jgi:hypothetical protein
MTSDKSTDPLAEKNIASSADEVSLRAPRAPVGLEKERESNNVKMFSYFPIVARRNFYLL